LGLRERIQQEDGEDCINQIHNLYSSPDDIWVNKQRRGAGHVACIGEMRNAHKFWLKNLKDRDHVGDLGIDGRI
jgi:hypothetical protein